jgi:hypothetical protein
MNQAARLQPNRCAVFIRLYNRIPFPAAKTCFIGRVLSKNPEAAVLPEAPFLPLQQKSFTR